MQAITRFGAVCALTFFCFFSSVFAQNSIKNDTGRAFFLAFEARPPKLAPFSIGGHAFVTWGFLKGKDSVAAAHTLGFFPSEHGNLGAALTKNRPGHVVRGFFENSSRQKIRQLVVEVDESAWLASLDSARAWDGRGYNLLRSNCVAFMDVIAEVAGLETPDAKAALGLPRTPVRYVSKLLNANSERASLGFRVFDLENGVCTSDFQEPSFERMLERAGD